MHVGNQSLDAALERWLAERHHRGACDASTKVYFAPFSPNGIGNKLLAMVMAFHMALMQGRRLVVTDWPPKTFDVSYALSELMEPSSCQPLFDGDKARPAVKKCTVIWCPGYTRSVFRDAFTQPHWAHMSPQFLDLPREWAHLDWLTWWRAITQFLLRPGPKLLEGLSATLGQLKLLRSAGGRSTPAEPLHRATPAERDAAGSARVVGFAARFGAGVASWASTVRRPLIGVHVRLGDGCWDSKRGGCKYVRSFDAVLTRLREAGLRGGTIFLATDNSTIASQAVRTAVEGFDVVALGEDRTRVEKSHARGDRRKEGDEMLHLQLLDLALLSQADILAGVFGSTFVKTALQLGRAGAYLSLDTFPWCPLLRCYWGWRDMCHNCELCYNSGGGGEACNTNGYHTAGGLDASLRDGRPARAAFKRFMSAVAHDFKCRPFAEHPLAPTMYDSPVVGAHYATSVVSRAPGKPSQPPPTEVCMEPRAAAAGSAIGRDCPCGFRRFAGVDNALGALPKPAFGYGTSLVPASTLRRAAAKNGRRAATAAGSTAFTLEDCERACCDETLCHSVTWRANTSTCVAALAIAHGARASDWCWHPTLSEHAVTSIRLPGSWEAAAQQAALSYLHARTLVRRGAEASGPRVLRKVFSTPVGHSHPMERTVEPSSCEQPSALGGGGTGLLEVSDMVATAVPFEQQLSECPSPTSWAGKPRDEDQSTRPGRRNRRRGGRRQRGA